MRFPDTTPAILSRGLSRAAVLAALLCTGGCGAVESVTGGSGSTLNNLIKYGSTTEPPVQRPAGEVEASYCPQVQVIPGRAAIQHGGGQVSISNIARECIERPDGSVVVKVGIEGLALVGPKGGGGRFNVPVVFRLTQDEKVLVTRTRQASVSVGGGEAQASFVTVEGGMVVPARSGTFDIEVGLGGAAGGRSSRR